MTGDIKENDIEFYTNDKMMTVTLSQKRYINKILKLAQNDDSIIIIRTPKENQGYLLAKLPISYLRFVKPYKMSDAQKKNAIENLSKFWKN